MPLHDENSRPAYPPMLIRNKNPNYLTTGLKGIAFPLFVIVFWELASRAGVVNAYFLPAPSRIYETFVDMLRNGLLARHLLASIVRLTYGFLITVFFAVPMGILAGKTRTFRLWVSPMLSFLQQIPPIAWIPIFILWLGIEEASKIAVIVYASFFPVFLNTIQGVTSVDPKLVETGRAYMLSPLEMIRKVYIPSAMMFIFVGLRLGLSNCWRALVGAELIAASTGIGSLIIEGRQLAQPDKIFVAVLTIGLAGLCIDTGLKYLENRLMPWEKAYQSGEQR
ncbi:MAG: putative aliphatic sulfonates transport permease protein SsuC [Candidatus Dichloromethanomonas elyunquensis]|nr:MAG: putative aliphatic sulfonates transport permease protein SsuC [Candidatus Dichloromethanomonas elyunquensis]